MLGLLQPILPPGVAADPHAYRHAVWTIAYSMFFKFEIFFIMLLVVIAGPNLISRDLRFNALPLYFSRPLRRLDYFLGKLGVIAALVAAVAVVPAVAAYVLGVCFSLDLGVIRDTWRLLPASILYGLVIVVSAGTLMLALSSLSRRSLYVGIAWVGLWIISSAVAGVLGGIQRETLFHTHLAGRDGPRQCRTERRAAGSRRAAVATAPRNRLRRAKRGSDVRQRVEQARGRSGADQLAAALLLHRQPPTPGRGAAEHRRRLGGDRPGHRSAAGRHAAVLRRGGGREPAPINERRLADQMVPQYPWIWSAGVLAGLLGLSLWTLSTAREIAGPAEVTPVVEFDGVSKWYGNVIGLNKLTLRIPPGVTGLLGSQRGRQVHAAATGHRATPAQPGAACASSGTGPGTTRP